MCGAEASRRSKLQKGHSVGEEDWVIDYIKRLSLRALDL